MLGRIIAAAVISFAAILIAACAGQRAAEAADEINFGYINSCRTTHKGAALYCERGGKIRTDEIAAIASLAEKCRRKGIKSGIDANACCEYLADAYVGQGRFLAEASSSDLADEAASAGALLALAENYDNASQALKSKIDKVVDDARRTKLDPLRKAYGENAFSEKDGVKGPSWLVDGRGDVTSVYLTALCSSEKLAQANREYIRMLADGIKSFTSFNYDEFPYCAHYESMESPHLFTLSSNRQTMALCLAGRILGDQALIESAKKEADNFSVYLLSSYGPICGMAPAPVIYPQTPQGAMTFVENLAVLHETSNEPLYGKLAGLACSWFYEGNSSGKAVYDRATGESSVSLTKDGPSGRTSLKASAEALHAIASIHGTDGWKYRKYRVAAEPHAFKILQAEEGKAVRKDYEIAGIEYPGGEKGSLVEIMRENSFWLRFSIEEDDEYAFHLCYLKQQGFGASTSILMRIDGDKIYSVPLGGSSDNAYMFMQEVLERRTLLEGLHSMGIKFSGLLLGKAATLDCVTLQPLNQRKTFIDESGNMISIVKSLHKDETVYNSKKLERDGMSAESCQINSDGRITPGRIGEDGSVRLPSYGYIIFEGKKL